MGCIGPSVVVGPTIVKVLVGGTGPTQLAAGSGSYCVSGPLVWARSQCSWLHGPGGSELFPAHWWTVPSPGAAGCITHCVLQLVMDHYWADKPLVWDLEHVAFFACPLRTESLFLTAHQLSCTQGQLAFKSRCCGCLSYWFSTPGLGSPMRASVPFILGENLCLCKHSPFCGCPTLGGGWSWIYCISVSPSYLMVSYLYLLLWKILC